MKIILAMLLSALPPEQTPDAKALCDAQFAKFPELVGAVNRPHEAPTKTPSPPTFRNPAERVLRKWNELPLNFRTMNSNKIEEAINLLDIHALALFAHTPVRIGTDPHYVRHIALMDIDAFRPEIMARAMALGSPVETLSYDFERIVENARGPDIIQARNAFEIAWEAVEDWRRTVDLQAAVINPNLNLVPHMKVDTELVTEEFMQAHGLNVAFHYMDLDTLGALAEEKIATARNNHYSMWDVFQRQIKAQARDLSFFRATDPLLNEERIIAAAHQASLAAGSTTHVQEAKKFMSDFLRAIETEEYNRAMAKLPRGPRKFPQAHERRIDLNEFENNFVANHPDLAAAIMNLNLEELGALADWTVHQSDDGEAVQSVPLKYIPSLQNWIIYAAKDKIADPAKRNKYWSEMQRNPRSRSTHLAVRRVLQLFWNAVDKDRALRASVPVQNNNSVPAPSLSSDHPPVDLSRITKDFFVRHPQFQKTIDAMSMAELGDFASLNFVGKDGSIKVQTLSIFHDQIIKRARTLISGSDDMIPVQILTRLENERAHITDAESASVDALFDAIHDVITIKTGSNEKTGAK